MAVTLARGSAVSFDVPGNAAANRQRTAKSDAKFINISEASLANSPGLKSRFIDVLNAMEDFRSAFETGARSAKMVPDGHSVTFTRGKFGWCIVIGEARASSGGVSFDVD
jgi:hypothetical protein